MLLLRWFRAVVFGCAFPHLGSLFIRRFNSFAFRWASLRAAPAASSTPAPALWSAFFLELSRGLAFDLRPVAGRRFDGLTQWFV